jgi:hypothetical protein
MYRDRYPVPISSCNMLRLYYISTRLMAPFYSLSLYRKGNTRARGR